MAPRFTTLMYQIYPSDNGANALVCFPFDQSELIFPFRDKLSEALLKLGKIQVHKTQGYPLPPDSTFLFYSEKYAKSVEEFLHRKRPSFFSRLMTTTEWVSFQNEEKIIGEIINAEIETSHDYTCIVFNSSIHSEVSMSELLQEVAKDLKMTLPRNNHLGTIRNVVTSNQRFEL